MATQLKENTHADDDAFRTEVREFLAENFPEELKANLLAGLKIPTNETPLHTKWRESYRCSGLGTPTGPKAYEAVAGCCRDARFGAGIVRQHA